MAHSTDQLLQWIGIPTAAQRNAVTADLFPAPRGLQHLTKETKSGIEEAVVGYSKRRQGAFRISRVQLKWLISLMYWVQDQQRIDKPFQFGIDITEAQFFSALEESYERQQCREDQKKIGESLISSEFQIQLKSTTQWQRWYIELQSVLGSIIGSSGIPLTYVIRDDSTRPAEFHNWETEVIYSAALTGRHFTHDAKTVHQVLLRNIAEDSDAYTYIKTHLRRENGRVDIIALRERYENTSSMEARVNEAKRLFDSLQYRNERSMPFEQFSAKLQKAVDELELGGRPMHNLDIVSALWGKINCAELKGFVDALKVDQMRTPRPYTDIIQDIATEVPNLVSSSRFKSNVSEVNTTRFTRQVEERPVTGVLTKDDKLFIGNYTAAQWRSDSVREHHDQIRKVREANPVTDGGPRPKKFKNKIKKNKRKLASLKKKIQALKEKKATIAAAKANTSSPAASDSDDSDREDQAGKAFGGKGAKKRQKGK